MANYLHRLNAVEKLIAPRDSAPSVRAVILDGQTEEEALAAHAAAHGLTISDVRRSFVFLSYVDGRLQR